jgi:hypothetical protein
MKRGGREKGSVTYDEGEMKLGFQFGLACGIPSILVANGGQEMVGDLVTQRPLVRKCGPGGFEKRVKCASLVVEGEGEVCDVETLRSRRYVLVEILEEKRFCVFRLISCARDGSTKVEQKKWSRVLLTV